MTTRSSVPGLSAALFGLAGLIDISFLSVAGSKDAAPLPVLILFALFGVVTLAALVPARRGNRLARVTVVALRVISALLALVSFFAGAPLWVMVGEAVVIVSTIVALVFLWRRPTSTVPA